MVVFVVVSVLACLVVAAVLAAPLRAASPRLSAAVLVVVPVLAFALYRLIGTPAALDPEQVTPIASLGDGITHLEADLARNPDRVEGWFLLARAYAEDGRPVEARDALARAAKLAPDDVQVQLAYAESRAQAAPDRVIDAEAVAVLERVLAKDPAQQRARWFLGIAKRQAGDDAAAAALWEPLLSQVDARTAETLRPQIDAARRDAGLAPLPATAPVVDDAAPATATANALRVRVRLDDAFASRVRLPGDATVFVIARLAGGPPMPLAVERHRLQDLPLDVTLDDGDSPMPTQRLSALTEVEVVARISASGNAMRAEGDVESPPVRVALPARGPVDLVIGAPAP